MILLSCWGPRKDHKKDLPLQSVVGACDGPATGISIVLERILHQLLPYVTANLVNTPESLKDIETKCLGLRAPAGTVLVTMDVVEVYTSIPINEGVDAVMEVLQTHQVDINMFGLDITSIRELLQFVLKSNYFRFGTQIYRQVDGVAMRDILAQPFAIILMHALEC